MQFAVYTKLGWELNYWNALHSVRHKPASRLLVWTGPYGLQASLLKAPGSSVGAPGSSVQWALREGGMETIKVQPVTCTTHNTGLHSLVCSHHCPAIIVYAQSNMLYFPHFISTLPVGALLGWSKESLKRHPPLLSRCWRIQQPMKCSV